MAFANKGLLELILRFRGEGKDRNNTPTDAANALDYHFITELKKQPLFPSLEENHKFLKQLFEECSDVVMREFQIDAAVPALLVFVDGLVNSQILNETMNAIMTLGKEEADLERILATMLPVSQTSVVDNIGELLLAVLSGDTCLIVENNTKAIMMGIRGPEKRAVGEPETESNVRGPREGFVESLRTNTSLIRRRLKTPRLKMKSITLGRESNTNLVIAYMDDIALPSLVEEVIKRIKKIDMDGILDSGNIEELIQDDAYSPFPQIQYTERPDVVTSALLGGRVAIIVDGTPFVLLVPFVFVQIMQASEDYYERYQIATFLRWLRYLFLFLSLTTPALYVAVTTYHQDLLPTSLMLSVAAAREAIPFPSFVEALIMEITFEALREAGIRLPKAVGSAVSILGALVIGQAAVQAGIVSAPMVIVVSITGIASFTIPRFNGAIAIRIMRFPFLLGSALFGFYGIFICMMILIGHLASLRSFGVPYLSPLAPLSAEDLKDVAVRAPLWQMQRRPSFMAVQDRQKMDPGMTEEIAEKGGMSGSDIQHKQNSGKEDT
jgi:spore germination protein